MPSVSKQQQKFFGLVRALQKGDVSPSSVTKKARDAAKDMKKSDVKKFASTKHKGLPRKVKGETKVKSLIKKMVREELKKLDEKCWKGYEKKGTKMMFGKRYPNCVKKETIDKLNEKLTKSEIKKMRDKFNKTGKLPPHLMKLAKLMDKHTEVRNIVVPGLEWMSKLGEGKITEAVKFSSSQINQLVKAFKNVKGDVLPKNHPLMTQVTKLLKQTDKKTLQQIKSADIPYLSVIALDLLNEVKLTEAIQPSKAINKVLDMADGGYGKLGGKLVDGLSANLFKAVYNKANDTNKEKMNKMNEKQLYVFLTKLWTKFGKQVKL
jgi:hypothetical protein